MMVCPTSKSPDLRVSASPSQEASRERAVWVEDQRRLRFVLGVGECGGFKSSSQIYGFREIYGSHETSCRMESVCRMGG